MMFEIEETFTYEDYDAWVNTHALHGKILGPASKAAVGFGRMWGLFMAIFGGLLLLGGLLGGVLNLLTLLGLGILLIGLRAFRKNRDVRTAMSAIRRGHGLETQIPDAPMRFTFEEDGFSVWTPGSDKSYRYHAVTGIWEDGGRFYLFLQGQMQYILQKGAFTIGGPDGFRTFVHQKTGKPVENVR